MEWGEKNGEERECGWGWQRKRRGKEGGVGGEGREHRGVGREVRMKGEVSVVLEERSIRRGVTGKEYRERCLRRGVSGEVSHVCRRS